jgi:hypothetical protein
VVKKLLHETAEFDRELSNCSGFSFCFDVGERFGDSGDDVVILRDSEGDVLTCCGEQFRVGDQSSEYPGVLPGRVSSR